VYLRSLGRPWLTAALGLMLVVAALDFLEDQHILALLEDAEHSILPSARAITLQTAESGLKWSLSYLSLFLFGLAIPRTTKLGVALALVLTVGNVVTGALAYAMPVSRQIANEVPVYVGFIISFVLSAVWLRRASDAPATA
jgi:hypothetical protein